VIGLHNFVVVASALKLITGFNKLGHHLINFARFPHIFVGQNAMMEFQEHRALNPLISAPMTCIFYHLLLFIFLELNSLTFGLRGLVVRNIEDIGIVFYFTHFH
jgi:hypothetical protein